MARPLFILAVLATAMPSSSPAAGQPTHIDVRVISKGAKFIGTSMGGVEITVRDADTGEILARGKAAGTTGDTSRIMRARTHHHDPVSTEDAPVFRATLDLDEPRRIKVTARGPLAQPQAINTVSSTQWIVPGKHVVGGDGFVLEMSGFVVDVLAPPAHLELEGPSLTVTLRANVTMMCGCPIEPDGIWDAKRIEVAAILKHNGRETDRVFLNYAGQTSQFATAIEISEPGTYEVAVYAYDAATGNTGLDLTTFSVAE